MSLRIRSSGRTPSNSRFGDPRSREIDCGPRTERQEHMTSPADAGDIFTLPPEGTGTDALEVFGPTVEFISFSTDDHNQICVMRGVIPPGVTVPLHSHADFE